MMRLLRWLLTLLSPRKADAIPSPETNSEPSPVPIPEPPKEPKPIINRRFMPGVPFVATTNHGGKLQSVSLIVIHYTAGGSVESAVSTFTDPAKQVSAHFIIGRNGAVTQLVPLDTVAWHAGASSWRGSTNVNNRSIGIELVNWGLLTHENGIWCSWSKTKVPDSQVKVVGGYHWQTYTESQIKACIDVVRYIQKVYPNCEIVGHSQISPGRKQDPGPAFPMERLA